MSCANAIRQVLQHSQSALTAHDILARIPMPAQAQTVHTIIATELAAKRIQRTGTRGQYTYTLTDTGHSAARNPRWLRSRFNRRTRYD